MRTPTGAAPARTAIALAVAALILSACSKAEEVYHTAALPNVSLDRTPSTTEAGRVDPKRASVSVRVGDSAVVAAFRASSCDKPAPGFEEMMREQARSGLRVPDGITLFDAGIGRYTSRTCGKNTPARAIGVYGRTPGTYVLPFFGGESTKKVTVR